MRVAGGRLSWSGGPRAAVYVLETIVPGATPTYSVIHAAAAVPTPLPGRAVSYRVAAAGSVAAAVHGGVWSTTVTISFPAGTPERARRSTGTPSAPSAPSGASTPSGALAAETISVSGQTLSWPGVPGVTEYVFVRKVPGQADQYADITRYLDNPAVGPRSGRALQRAHRRRPEAPGPPRSRSAIAAGQRAGADADADAADPHSDPDPDPGRLRPADGRRGRLGAVVRAALHPVTRASTARLEFDIDTPVATMIPMVQAYARAGIRPLLLASFYGRVASVSPRARPWPPGRRRSVPGGSAWSGGGYPAGTAVTDIEFGNETNESYQFADTAGVSGFSRLPSYAARAQSYALSAAAASQAITAANPQVGLLAIGDPGGGGTQWVDNMFKAVPDLGSLVAGWSVHAYGPNWQSVMDETIASTQADGAPATIPLYATEWGLSTDDGRCLDDNYGFDKCMSYAEAAATLQSALTAMQARYGQRLRAFYLYQAHDQQPTGTATGREAYFGALQSNGAAKGAYTSTVESDLATYR